MKAWRYGNGFGYENLKIVELPEPKPGPGEALVRVRSCSLNFRDLAVLKGDYGKSVKPPLIPLSDGAGEVVAVGDGVTRVKPGDRVAAIFMQTWLDGPADDAKAASALGGAINGMLSEMVVLKADGLVHFPDHLSFEEAAALPCAAVTAWNALFVSGKVQPGETVLTLGSGGVSTFAISFAKMAGARVIATTSSDQKGERLRTLGAEHIINYKTDTSWHRRVRELTGGVGADHVVEVGGPGTLPLTVKAVKSAGHIALIGVLAGRGEFDPTLVFLNSIRIQGILVGSRAMFEDMNRAIRLTGFHPAMDRIFEFDQFPEAISHLERGAHFGKIGISVTAS